MDALDEPSEVAPLECLGELVEKADQLLCGVAGALERQVIGFHGYRLAGSGFLGDATRGGAFGGRFFRLPEAPSRRPSAAATRDPRQAGRSGRVARVLISPQGAQPQIRLRGRTASIPSDDRAQVIRATRIAALAHPVVQPRGPQAGVAGERVPDERHEGVRHRLMCGMSCRRDARPPQHSTHGAVIDVQPTRERADPPVLGVV